MSISDEEIEFVKDLFADVGKITTRKMFGGLAIYSDGTIFGLVIDEGRITIKAKDDLAKALADDGSTQFTYDGKNGKAAGMPYWTLPEAALDDPELACDWAKKSLAANY